MKEQDWKKLQTPAHIRNIMQIYSKLKGNFANEKKIDGIAYDFVTIYGIDKIKEELIQMKVKLEKYKKTSGLDKI